jgi:putative ABC transport system permease protein
MTSPASERGVLERQEGNVVANASVLSYTEITPDNIDSFHFHGDPDAFPVDAIIAQPKDRRSDIVLRGRYEERGGSVQMLVPLEVIGDLLATVLSVRDFVILGSVGVGLATVATAILVFVLSVRLRKREIETIRKIGGARQRVQAILATEILLVVGLSACVTTSLVVAVGRFGPAIASMLLG